MGLSGASCEVTEVVINRGNLNLNLTLKVDCWQTVKLMAVDVRVVFWQHLAFSWLLRVHCG